jgi:hypothetical protein
MPKKVLDRKKKSQNWINIYVLPFKTMASVFFIHMNVKDSSEKSIQ